jgi:hypothetical protein
VELGKTAWIDNIFGRLWPRLEAHAPNPKWMPKVEPSDRRKISVQEHGCGLYGCVLPTHDPNVVLKITSDPTEAWFVHIATQIGEWPEGIVKYYGGFAIPEATFRNRPVFALWRQAAYGVGLGLLALPTSSFDYRELRKFADKLRLYKGLAEDIRLRLRNAGESRWLLLDDAVKWKSRAEELVKNTSEAGRVKPLRGGLRIAATLQLLSLMEDEMEGLEPGALVAVALRFYRKRGMLLADVHSGNTGHLRAADRPLEGIVITDPGHAVALEKRWASVELPELPER